MLKLFKMLIQIHKYPLTEKLPTAFHEVIESVYLDEIVVSNKQSESVQLQYARYLLIAASGSKTVGRVIVYINPYHIMNGNQVLTIGYLEIIKHEKVWKELVNAVIEIAEKMHITTVIGPLNGSTWEAYRLTEPSPNPLFLSEPYYPEYYPEFLKKCGFKPLANYVSNIDRVMNPKKERELKKELELSKIIHIRPIDKENLRQELEDIFPLVHTAFEDNFLYSPITMEAFVTKYLKLEKLIIEDMVLIAEDLETMEKVGFILAFPDFLNQHEKGFIIKTVARHKDRKYAGIGSVLGNKVTRYAGENGYMYCIHAFMISSNSSTSISASFTGEEYKKHTLFYKDLKNE